LVAGNFRPDLVEELSWSYCHQLAKKPVHRLGDSGRFYWAGASQL